MNKNEWFYFYGTWRMYYVRTKITESVDLRGAVSFTAGAAFLVVVNFVMTDGGASVFFLSARVSVNLIFLPRGLETGTEAVVC